MALMMKLFFSGVLIDNINDDAFSFSRVVVFGRFSFLRDRIVEINGDSVSFSRDRCMDTCFLSGDRCVCAFSFSRDNR